ncbi:MAG: hypothetical protein M0Z43_02285 [Acidithiobacillus sp.]|nr:hypothetical protein [Acidithiobacillus sp.]
MGPAEFLAKMKAIAVSGGSLDDRHRAADELMCALLVRLGYGDSVVVFEDMEKWYA